MKQTINNKLNTNNMFNSIAIVNVTSWNNGKTDKNGATPVLLKAIAGKSIDKSILSGTLATSQGFELNKSYMVQISEREPDTTYGRQFSFTNLGEITGVDLIKAVKELGSPAIAKVTVEEDEIEMATTSAEAVSSKKVTA